MTATRSSGESASIKRKADILIVSRNPRVEPDISKIITTLKGEPYWAQVLIDGVSKGRTPLLLELPTGKYQVRVERPGFKSQEREIRVASGKAAVVRIDLTQ